MTRVRQEPASWLTRLASSLLLRRGWGRHGLLPRGGHDRAADAALHLVVLRPAVVDDRLAALVVPVEPPLDAGRDRAGGVVEGHLVPVVGDRLAPALVLVRQDVGVAGR